MTQDKAQRKIEDLMDAIGPIEVLKRLESFCPSDATALFGLVPGPPAPPMPPPPTDAPGTMLIRFERTPRCLWHPSCAESRNAIVREVEITTAYGIVECTVCGRRAKLPVGSGVETRCEEIPQPNH